MEKEKGSLTAYERELLVRHCGQFRHMNVIVWPEEGSHMHNRKGFDPRAMLDQYGLEYVEMQRSMISGILQKKVHPDKNSKTKWYGAESVNTSQNRDCFSSP